MYEEITPESIKEEILKELSNQGLDVREGSYLNDLISPAAVEMWKVYGGLNAVIPIAFVDETSGGYLDKRASEYGIKRREGVKAAVTLALTGEKGCVVPKESVFVSQTGLEFVTLEEVTFYDNGTVQAAAQAEEIGEAYNVPANSIQMMYQSIAGLISVTNPQAAEGGTDPESDESLYERLSAFLQRPATSGNVYQYEQWAMSVDGVGGVRVTPLWNGPGTVGVCIIGYDRKPVADEIVDRCAEYIETVRPIGASVTVTSAKGLNLAITANVKLSGTTVPAVQATYTEAVEEYLRSISFSEQSEVKMNQLGAILMNQSGVIDYSSLKVNGNTQNIALANDQVPVLSKITLQEEST